jgi:endonuclease/exonuclease/phosphatase family metal-dependent hydrolase
MTAAPPGPCRTIALRWISPDDESERKRLASWCAGVGDALLRSSAVVDPLPPLEAITFVSWNVHVGNGDIQEFVADLRAGRLTEGRRVEHFVLMLQEVTRAEGVPPFAQGASGAARISTRGSKSADIMQVSRELDLSLIYVPSMRNGRSSDPASDRGSAILSTLPLSDPVAVELPGERQRRVVVLAKAGDVSVGVVHLDAFGGRGRSWIFWTPWMRQVQAKSVAPLLGDGSLVLGADLNTWHGAHEQAARFLAGLPGATPVSVDRPGLGVRVLDYLFFRAGADRRARCRQVSSRYGSDHHPVVGWVE